MTTANRASGGTQRTGSKRGRYVLWGIIAAIIIVGIILAIVLTTSGGGGY